MTFKHRSVQKYCEPKLHDDKLHGGGVHDSLGQQEVGWMMMVR